MFAVIKILNIITHQSVQRTLDLTIITKTAINVHHSWLCPNFYSTNIDHCISESHLSHMELWYPCLCLLSTVFVYFVTGVIKQARTDKRVNPVWELAASAMLRLCTAIGPPHVIPAVFGCSAGTVLALTLHWRYSRLGLCSRLSLLLVRCWVLSQKWVDPNWW